MTKTVSERLFEEYLGTVGITPRYEESVGEILKHMDHSFEVAGVTCRLDVKEFDAPPPMERGSFLGGAFDPYQTIRQKIVAARPQIKAFKGRGEALGIVLANPYGALVHIDTLTIYGAMFGDITVLMDFDPEAGSFDNARETFGVGGRMRHQKGKSVSIRNTSFSGIVVLRRTTHGGRRAHIKVEEIRRAQGASNEKPASLDEAHDRAIERLELVIPILQEPWAQESSLSVEVYENPVAAVPFPAGFPSGPWDERVGTDEAGFFARKYVGAALAQLEAEEATVGVVPERRWGFR